jgi:monofunctional biosynthetic peptidoglycan transglycosylase
MVKKLLKFILKLCLWFFIVSILLVVIYKWIPVPITPLMLIRNIEQSRQDKKAVCKHDWISIDEISKNIQLAVICSEDQNFLKHNGFDVEAIKKVMENNKKSTRLKGASSISQQVAKNVFLWPERSWLRKGIETYFTFLIELFWSKERILEVYLNSIEMGNGIYGIEAASQYWFKKSALKLTTYEAAAIAAILPGPLKYKANPASEYIQGRKEWIVRQMSNFGALDFKANNEKR